MLLPMAEEPDAHERNTHTVYVIKILQIDFGGVTTPKENYIINNFVESIKY